MLSVRVKVSLSILSHLLIGFDPVFARYLQISSGLNALVLLTATQWLSVPLVLGIMFIMSKINGCSNNDNNQHKKLNEEEINENNIELQEKNKISQNQEQSRLFKKKLLFSAIFAFVTICRDSSYVISCKFTAAYNIIVISLLGPFLMVIFSQIFLSEKISNTLWCCMLFSTIGIQLVVLSQSDAVGPETTNHLTSSDFLGMGLQLIAVVFMAIGRVIIQITWDVLTSSGLILLQNISIGFFVFIFTIIYNPSDWLVWYDLTISDWLIFFAYVFFVWVVGDLLQNASIRWIGSAEHATYQQLRIVTTLLLSYFLMNEMIESWIGWLGLVILISSISYFLVSRSKSSPVVAIQVHSLP